MRPGLAAIRRFYLPFILVQLASVSIVISYYHLPAFQEFCLVLAEWKVRGGLLFAALSTVLAGGILPEVAKALTGKLDLSQGFNAYVSHVFWICLMFVCSGILVERFYWLQGLIFSHDIGPVTVLTKVLVDQFLFSPFMSLPYAVLYFLWLEEERSLSRTWTRLTPRLMIERSLPLLFPNWVYWIPMTACIYSLPPDLQFPLFLTALAAWSLIFVAIAKQPSRDIPQALP
ncbi:MAG: hypothetical protein HC904_02885 [Blastochloris sp.]|nr:hypothetical protein [Blastochloris sp.]